MNWPHSKLGQHCTETCSILTKRINRNKSIQVNSLLVIYKSRNYSIYANPSIFLFSKYRFSTDRLKKSQSLLMIILLSSIRCFLCKSTRRIKVVSEGLNGQRHYLWWQKFRDWVKNPIRQKNRLWDVGCDRLQNRLQPFE